MPMMSVHFKALKILPKNPASVYFLENLQTFFAYLYVFPQ